MNKVTIALIFLLMGCETYDHSQNQETGTLFNEKTLEGWHITEFGPQGPVYVENQAIILGRGDGLTGVTWTKEFPRIDYKLSLEACRIDGVDFFCGLTFPILDSFCTLIIGGWGGMVVGLSNVDDLNASENITTRFLKFNSNQWYKIDLLVTKEKISVRIDDTVILDLPTTTHRFSIRTMMQPSTPLGITSWHTKAGIRNIQLESLELKTD